MATTRKIFAQQIQRLIYNDIPSDDVTISLNLINRYVNMGIAIAVKTNYSENLKIDGIGYVNSSFYTTFKGIAITKSTFEDFCYEFTLPEIPVALGRNEGVAQMTIKDGNNFSLTGVPLTTEQVPFRKNMRRIPNRFYYWYERSTGIIDSVLDLTDYTVNVKLASGGGDSSDLSTTINIPNEWLSFVQDYVVKNFIFERQQAQSITNDGIDAKEMV
jgi:hypothetical protein